MIRTQILLTPTLYETLKMQSAMERKSLSALVRDVLEKVLIRKKKTGGQILREMAKHAFSAPNLPKDFATNDKYLYGKNAPYDFRRR